MENKNEINLRKTINPNAMVSHDILLDIIKGVSIILVVLGHTYTPILKDYIYSFHVAVFFIVSGICINPKYTDNLAGLKKLLIKRVKSLWIPYVTWNFLFLLLQNFFLKIGFLTDNSEYFNLAPLLNDGFCKVIDFKGMIRAFIQSLFFLHTRPFVGGLWFLGGLFYSTFFYALQEYIFKKNKIKRFHFLFSILYICLAFYLVKSTIIQKVPFCKQVCIILLAESMLTIGTLIREYELMQKLLIINKYLGFFFSFILLILLSHFGSISFASVSIVNPIFFIAVTILGFMQMFYFSLIIQNKKFLCVLFTSSGIHTIPILALHTMFFKIITLIQVLLYREPKIYLALYPVWQNSLIWSLLYSIVGFGLSYLIALILSKNKVCKFFLKP